MKKFTYIETVELDILTVTEKSVHTALYVMKKEEVNLVTAGLDILTVIEKSVHTFF